VPTMGVPLPMIRLLSAGDVEENLGPQRRRKLTVLVWHDPSTRHLFAGPTVRASLAPGDLWSNPVAMADLLQLWTDEQGAAGGGARFGLN